MTNNFYSNFLARVADIVPYGKNAREHSREQVTQIVNSIREFGFTSPILMDADNVLIAGHGRLAAAREMGMTELPAIVIEGLSDAQKQALRLADNKLALNASWDDDLLRAELMDLRDVGFDLGLTGFGELELTSLFADMNDGLTDPDDVPEPPAEPVTVTGDVWTLGRHRLVCGDCTDAGVVEAVLAGVKPHLMVTDPPYGVGYDPAWRDRAVKVEFAAKRSVGKVTNDDRSDWANVWALFPGDVAYVWHAGIRGGEIAAGLAESGFEIKSQIIWAKQHFILGRGHYHWQHETCWYAVKAAANGHWQGDRTQSSVWNIKAQIGWESARPDNKDKATGHSTQKPVECMKRPIENNSSPGQAVYDPFSGSGTTIIAAEMTGRACHAIEISPTYCDVTIQRWMNFTGQTATRADGQTFDTERRHPVHAD